MDQTTLSIGDYYDSYSLLPLNTSSVEFSKINWVLKYSGTWIKVCPGFFKFGPGVGSNNTGSSTATRVTTTTTKTKTMTRKTTTTRALEGQIFF